MEIKVSKEGMEFEKELNELDLLVLDFTKVLEEIGIRYVVVSGYVPILFGRSRSSEDIDVIVKRMDKSEFHKLWEKLKEFECIITEDMNDAYENYLMEGHSIRFSRKNEFIPNIEIKFPKTELDIWTLQERIRVVLNRKVLYISPIELQIPYKLFLGSEKDIEDARYLYNIFKEYIDTELFREFLKKLKKEEDYERYLR